MSDPTIQRAAHAERAGVPIITEAVTTEKGHEAGNRRVRFAGVLERLTSLGHAERRAAERYQALFAVTCGGSPGQFGYAERIPLGSSVPSVARSLEAQDRLAAVRNSMPRWSWPVLDLIERDTWQDVSPMELQPIFCPGMSRRRARAIIDGIMSDTCKHLAHQLDLAG